MKKTALTGFMASMFVATGAAFAAEGDTALTTKKYVDDGLRAVYRRASDTYTKSEADSTFLKSDTAASTYLTQQSAAQIYATISAVEDAIEGTEYTADDNGGVAIDNEDHKIGLDFGDQTVKSGVSYVYQDGVFKELETVSEWNDSTLTQTSQSAGS